MEYEEIFRNIKQASRQLALISDAERNDILEEVAQAIDDHHPLILEANRADLALMDKDNPLYDRLLLSDKRLEGIAADMRHVATLPSPLGRVLKHRVLPNGLDLKRISVPFGVIGMVYEARPNVTFDVFALCMKSGNACLLKGGKAADHTNRAEVSLIEQVLRKHTSSLGNQLPVALLPSTHEATAALLNAVGYVDLCIPRGGKRLITLVRQQAKVPVIETGAGVVHVYFDKAGDVEIGKRVVDNSKTRRCSVCNALDTLLIHKDRLADFPAIVAPMAEKGVVLHADASAYEALQDHYPVSLLLPASADLWEHEWLSMQMGICTVQSEDEALAHIARYGSGHSESIVSEDAAAQQSFREQVDAACVYVNAPTSFTDGAQFGLGAEIGISTQKLGARGPMALEEITTYKWIIEGRGQVRE